MDDHERSRGFSPLPERSVGSYNETGHDEAWPSHTKAKRSGFHFTAGPIRTTSCFRCNGCAGSFRGRALLGTQQVCSTTRVIGGAPHRHKPSSCFSIPATEAKSVQGTEDVFVRPACLTSGQTECAFQVAKYTPDRQLMWATHIGGPGQDKVGGIAVSNIDPAPHHRDGHPQHPTVNDEATAVRAAADRVRESVTVGERMASRRHLPSEGSLVRYRVVCSWYICNRIADVPHCWWHTGSADNDVTVQQTPANTPAKALSPDTPREDSDTFLIEAAPHSSEQQMSP